MYGNPDFRNTIIVSAGKLLVYWVKPDPMDMGQV